MIRPSALLKRSLIFVHRWLGVALSVLFLLWFVSGIVMMYWGMPGVTARDRRERLPTLDPSRILVTPEQAYAALHRDEPPAGVTLSSFDGRPVYRFGGGGRGAAKGRGGSASMVFADDGTVPPPVDDALIDRVATGWARQPLSEAVKESMTEPDQWTLEGGMRTLRPLYKYSFADGQQVYVNGRTGEVMQYTTSESRFWAYLGAIPHWFYFTPLRVHQPQWFQFVVWSSAIGTVAAIIGVIVAIWMLSPKKRYRHAGQPTMVPYKGWKRWHTITGLLFGVVTTTWAFSGMLSMGPFDFIQRITGTAPPSPSPGAPRPFNPANALRGAGRFDIAAYAAKPPAAAIESIWADFKPKELEFTMFGGKPIYMATDTQGNTRIVPMEGPPANSFDAGAIMTMLRDAGGDFAELRVMDEYDAYYLDRRREAPLPVIYARLKDDASTRFYIDPATGRVAGNYNSRGWVSRWLYHGLHSLDFPFLYKYRPLWDIVVIGLMLGGTALCVTSLVLTWRVLQKKLATALKAGFQPPNEDLTPV